MWWRAIGRKVRGEGEEGEEGEIRVCLTNLWSRSYCSSTFSLMQLSCTLLSSRSRLCSLTHHHISCILLLTGLLREGDSWPVLAQTNLVLRNGFVHPWHMSATTSPCCLSALLTPHCITHLACLLPCLPPCLQAFLPTVHPLEKMLNLTTFNTLVPEPQTWLSRSSLSLLSSFFAPFSHNQSRHWHSQRYMIWFYFLIYTYTYTYMHTYIHTNTSIHFCNSGRGKMLAIPIPWNLGSIPK